MRHRETILVLVVFHLRRSLCLLGARTEFTGKLRWALWNILCLILATNWTWRLERGSSVIKVLLAELNLLRHAILDGVQLFAEGQVVRWTTVGLSEVR